MAFHNLRQSLPFPATFTVADGGPPAATVLCLLWAFFMIWFLRKRRTSATLPPGPYAWPIIGNLHQLTLPAHRSLRGLAEKYGPILFLRLGSVPTVVVSSSETAKEFLKTHDLIFASRPPTAAGRLMFSNSKDVVFAPYGDHWRQMRKICVLELLTAKRIESFKSVREEEVSAMISSIWEESENGKMGVNVSKAVSTLTSHIVWRILEGRKFSDDALRGDFKGFKGLMTKLTATVGEFNIGDFIPYLDWLDLQGIKRGMKKIHKKFDEFAEKIIDDHVNVNHLQKEAVDAEPHVQDFVDVLLHMAKADTKITRETIKAINFVRMGNERTALTSLCNEKIKRGNRMGRWPTLESKGVRFSKHEIPPLCGERDSATIPSGTLCDSSVNLVEIIIPTAASFISENCLFSLAMRPDLRS